MGGAALAQELPDLPDDNDGNTGDLFNTIQEDRVEYTSRKLFRKNLYRGRMLTVNLERGTYVVPKRTKASPFDSIFSLMLKRVNGKEIDKIKLDKLDKCFFQSYKHNGPYSNQFTIWGQGLGNIFMVQDKKGCTLEFLITNYYGGVIDFRQIKKIDGIVVGENWQKFVLGRGNWVLYFNNNFRAHVDATRLDENCKNKGKGDSSIGISTGNADLVLLAPNVSLQLDRACALWLRAVPGTGSANLTFAKH